MIIDIFIYILPIAAVVLQICVIALTLSEYRKTLTQDERIEKLEQLIRKEEGHDDREDRASGDARTTR